MTKKILLSLSGGVDSTTLLSDLLEKGHQVSSIMFNYGSKHNHIENRAAENIIAHYKTHSFSVDLRSAMSLFKSDLLLTGECIPKGHYTDASMKSTVVPSRNMIFLSILAGLAESSDFDTIAIGVHAGDHAIYPDCRFEFMRAMRTAVHLASGGKVGVIFPFIHQSKDLIVGRGLSLNVPYELTRTCYTNDVIACGTCGACVERLEAFKNCGSIDPIKYAI